MGTHNLVPFPAAARTTPPRSRNVIAFLAPAPARPRFTFTARVRRTTKAVLYVLRHF